MLLPDFSVAYREWISGDGEMRPRVAIQAPPSQTWAADENGLIMTGNVIDTNGDGCCLTVLFPMPLGAACAKVRQRRFPVKPGDMLTIRRQVDRVVGDSGEEYSRFLADVIPMGDTDPAAHEG